MNSNTSAIIDILKRNRSPYDVWAENGVGHLYGASTDPHQTAVPRQPKQRPEPEHDLQTAVRDTLLLDGWLVIWMNSGAMKQDGRFVIFNRWQISGQPANLGGVSDLIAVGHGETLFLELKTPTGKLSSNQKAFQASVTAAGGTYEVIRTVEDLRPFLRRVEL